MIHSSKREKKKEAGQSSAQKCYNATYFIEKSWWSERKEDKHVGSTSHGGCCARICLQSCQIKPNSTSIRQLARTWDVPYATFRRRILGMVKGCGHESGRNTVLPDTAEKELANVISD